MCVLAAAQSSPVYRVFAEPIMLVPMWWLLVWCLPAMADVFAEQHRQLEQYYLSELRKAKPGRRELLAERLGTVTPVVRDAVRTLVAVWPDFRVEEVSVEVEPGHRAHAVVLTPARAAGRAMIVAGPAERPVEEWAGPTEGAEVAPWLAGLLGDGYTVCLMVTVERSGDHPLAERTRKDRRHILHRLGFVTGRTVTGLVVTEIRGMASYLKMPVGLWGEGDGALAAAYAAAVDSRFTSLNLSQYNLGGAEPWREPVDRTIFGGLADVGAPETRLPAVKITGAPEIRGGERLLKVEVEERRNRHYNGLLSYLRARIAASGRVRRQRHNLLATPPEQATPRLMADLNALMGGVPSPVGAMKARLQELGGSRDFAAYDVTLDVLPGVEVYGQLLVPRERQEARLPAVVAQHGLGGKPKDLTLQGEEPNAAYHGYAARLAEHGYVVFAPYVVVPIPQAELINPLVRMANLLGRMRTNIEVAKLRRIVDFLVSLDYVDGGRLGYYGLSYGGYSTIWMGPLEPRFKATVVSGHFNDWTEKITNEVERTSYLQHPDEDFYNWNVLNRLTHVELLAAFWPRAVMVEYAQHDGTTFPAWHERAWGEVEQVARAWNASERMVRDRFVGVHEIHGIGAFDFLDRWLRPEGASRRERAGWGEVSQVMDENPLSRVKGKFRVGTRQPVFEGLEFRARAEAAGARLVVRYGLTPGGKELGEVVARWEDGWAVAAVPARRLDGWREYHFTLRAEAGQVVLTGPKPLGGRRFPEDFAVAYRPRR
jgi:dienelactone hydrolase